MSGFAVAVHGGAGAITQLAPERERVARAGLQRALEAAAAVLDGGGSAVDAVVAAVVVLEDDPNFNAGRGSVFTADATIELDAAVMDGRDRRAGAVTCVRTVRNPVVLAREVMRRTPHVLLAGDGAERFAREIGVDCVDPATWHETEARRRQLEEARARHVVKLDHDDVRGTVGAVARDRDGHVAAATSTGGMVNKRPGRVGDTPVIGAGTWAWDATCAVSATGHGERFVLQHVGARISDWMDLRGVSVAEAAARVIGEVPGAGGVIAVDRHGNLALPFDTGGMYRGWIDRDGRLEVAIF